MHLPSQKIWQSRDRTLSDRPPARPSVRTTGKFKLFLKDCLWQLLQRKLRQQPWGDTKGLHCKYPGELHTIPYNFVIRNCMELSRRLFLISLGAADFVTYDQREVFLPKPFCQENVIIWKQNRHDRVGGPKPAKIKGFSSSISEVSFVSIDLVKNQVFRLSVIKYCLILFSRTFRKRDKRDNWLEKEAWKRFFGREFFLIPAAILRNREAQYIQFLPKPSWLSSVMPSQLKMNLVCIAKAAKIELKKKMDRKN